MQVSERSPAAELTEAFFFCLRLWRNNTGQTEASTSGCKVGRRLFVRCWRRKTTEDASPGRHASPTVQGQRCHAQRDLSHGPPSTEHPGYTTLLP